MPVEGDSHAQTLVWTDLSKGTLEVVGLRTRLLDEGVHFGYDFRIVVDDALHRLGIPPLSLVLGRQDISRW